MAVRARRRSILRARRSPSARRGFVKLTFRRLERSEPYRQTAEIYAPGVAESDDVIAAEPWGEDRKLLELLGVRGAAGFRAMFDGFPEAVRGIVGVPGRRGGDRRLHLRLWQSQDVARVPPPGATRN